MTTGQWSDTCYTIRSSADPCCDFDPPMNSVQSIKSSAYLYMNLDSCAGSLGQMKCLTKAAILLTRSGSSDS
ncbi:hypothetical protein T265_10588 [Opisthorchis viverrini]|uniref:Uncharacterized protein n=1 Tax=Opisthorchis viverrini TaxID=6198 RepID=A0A074Z1X0_OPIVI|nr:hypothetical protein T265_10588 [Opisthorchis viverrini]KER20978.1 hypothetical protein T265_10588 [Opisthorchis viverrini]